MHQVRAGQRSDASLCPSCQGLITPDGRCACAEGAFPLVGTTLGGTWKLNAVLGAGGMGRVYDAMDLSLSRRVAVKVLDRNAPGTLRERFVREAAVLGKLDHPSIVPVYAAGQTSSGEPFIVMKWLDGVDLRRWALKGDVALSELLPLLRDVAAGLDALHAHGVVHRDIKPENLMVLSSGRAMIIDLGVARTAGSRLTAVGFTVGTVGYIAPEQLNGDATTAATDLYALALVAWELLANRRDLDRLAASRQLAERMAGRLPTLTSLNPSIPPVVSHVFEKALALSPADRFESGAAFISALEEAGGRKVAQGPRTTPVQRWPFVVAAAVAIALGVASLLASTMRDDPAPLPEVTDVRSWPATQQRVFVDGLPTNDAALSWRAKLLRTELEALVIRDATSALLTARYGQLKARYDQAPAERRVEAAKAVNDLVRRSMELRAEVPPRVTELTRLLSVQEPSSRSPEVRSVIALSESYFHHRGTDPLGRAMRLNGDEGRSTTVEAVRALDVKNDRAALATAVRLLVGLKTREDVLEAQALLTPVPADFKPLSELVAEVLSGFEEETAPVGVLAKFPDDNSVVDDVSIGQYKRELRDGQSITSMLDRMSQAVAQHEDKEGTFERPLLRVKQACAEANTKRTLIDCDDDVRLLHGRFFRE